MTARDEVLSKLWNGVDPFANFPVADFSPDHRGWNSEHRYLSEAIDKMKPRIVVEVGVWKGGSVKTMAHAAKRLDLDCVIIAIDTWLGSAEHWDGSSAEGDFPIKNGYPQLYHVFAANLFDKNLSAFVVPLPLDSVNACHVINNKAISPNVIHIDAGHDYHSAMADLQAWWPLLAPGGMLIGDDYYTDGITWQGVRQAFDDFLRETAHEGFETEEGKCVFHKPLAA